jgi:hypothetical protein
MILDIQICGLGRAITCGVMSLAVTCGAAVNSYKVPKQPAAASGSTAVAPAAVGGQPVLSYKAPSDWQEVPPGSIRIASFKVKGSGASQADVSIVPLAGSAGSDLDNVNRWRQQVGLAPVEAGKLAGLGEKVTISGGSAQLYDVAGQPADATGKVRILAAMQRMEGGVFFYKMTGSADLVAKQKPAFIDFLKSVKIEAQAGGPEGLPPSHPPIGNTAGAEGAGQPVLPPSHPPIGGQQAGPVALPPSHPPIGEAGGASPAPAGASKWKVPAGWQEQAPGMMQSARFLAAGEGGTKAEVSVASFPGESGGLLGNVNRWRKQIGLGPIEAADLPKQTSTLEAGGTKASVLDVTSEDKKRRLIAVSVPGGGSTTFYKLLGDEAVVAKEKEAFLRFVQSPQ